MVPQSAAPTANHFWRYALPPFALAGAAVVELWNPGFSNDLAGWPFVVSLLLIGMPHGATDLRVSGYLRGESRLMSQVAKFSGYTLVLVLSLTLFIAAPELSLALFAVLSGLHFGIADARDLDRRTVQQCRPELTYAAAISRGSLLMSLPFFFSPAESVAVVNGVLEVAGSETMFQSSSMTPLVAAIIAAVGVMCFAASSVLRLRRGSVRATIIDGLELASIVAAFAVLHPLFAMGTYLIAWHGWRHLFLIGPLLVSDRDRPRGKLSLALLRLHVQSLPLLIPTVLAFLFVAWWRLDTWTSATLAFVVIAMYVVVTLPHHLLIERLTNRLEKDRAHSLNVSNSHRSMSHA